MVFAAVFFHERSKSEKKKGQGEKTKTKTDAKINQIFETTANGTALFGRRYCSLIEHLRSTIYDLLERKLYGRNGRYSEK